MTMDTKTLRDYDRRYVWHPFTQMKEWEEDAPLVIVGGDGSWLIEIGRASCRERVSDTV